MTSDIPLFKRRKPRPLQNSEDFGQMRTNKSQANLFVDTIGSIEAKDRLDQFNKYLVKDAANRPNDFANSKS